MQTPSFPAMSFPDQDLTRVPVPFCSHGSLAPSDPGHFLRVALLFQTLTVFTSVWLNVLGFVFLCPVLPHGYSRAAGALGEEHRDELPRPGVGGRARDVSMTQHR